MNNVSLEEGEKNLKELCGKFKAIKEEWNEADTRFHFIDELLRKCLGWPNSEFHLEKYTGGEYADYILGKPGRMVVEAKKVGVHFELPAGNKDKSIVSLKSLLASCHKCKEAVEQAQNYCASNGIEYGVVCNGPQLIAFIGITIGEPPLLGKALVIKDLNDLSRNFPLIWNHLSPDGVIERKLHRLLTTGTTGTLPPKPSSRLIRFPNIRYSSELQDTLRNFSELLIEDIVITQDFEEQFLRECYCDTGALSRDALLSKNILSARYAALFPSSEENPQLHSVETRIRKKSGFSDDVMQEALARRPIVLLGDGGVGKTSFIKNLMLVKAPEEFKKALFLYIDLGSQGSLAENMQDFILLEIEHQLSEKYDVDIEASNFVKGVYHLEVEKFRKSIYVETQESNLSTDDQLIASMLVEKIKNKSEHLRRVVDHISKGRKKQVVVFIDNADQRAIKIQQEAFVIAQDFGKNWNALTFISVRPQTFFMSKRAGVLSAYPHRIFTIS